MLKSIIIDDEQHCIDTLKWQLETYCPKVSLLAVFSNPKDGLAFIQANELDLLFIDVEMPEMNGFELLSQVEQPGFDIIFTTAYNKFAVQAIKISALDYLVKPIDEDELVEAIQKALNKKASDQTNAIELLLKQINQKSLSDRIYLPTMNGLEFVDTNQVLRCESDSNYTTVFIDGQKPITVSKTLKEVEEMLSIDQFFRVHNSHIVNLKFVSKYVKGDGGHLVMLNQEIIPVSRSKKQELLDFLKK